MEKGAQGCESAERGGEPGAFDEMEQPFLHSPLRSPSPPFPDLQLPASGVSLDMLQPQSDDCTLALSEVSEMN